MVFDGFSWFQVCFSCFFMVPGRFFMAFHGFSLFQVGFSLFHVSLSWIQVGFYGFSLVQVGFPGFFVPGWFFMVPGLFFMVFLQNVPTQTVSWPDDQSRSAARMAA